MPHTHAETLSLPVTYRRAGESRFARPVAAITAVVKSARVKLAEMVTLRTTAAVPRIRQDIEVRALEERFAQATDHGDLERMERAFERREADRAWDWR